MVQHDAAGHGHPGFGLRPRPQIGELLLKLGGQVTALVSMGIAAGVDYFLMMLTAPGDEGVWAVFGCLGHLTRWLVREGY